MVGRGIAVVRYRRRFDPFGRRNRCTAGLDLGLLRLRRSEALNVRAELDDFA